MSEGIRPVSGNKKAAQRVLGEMLQDQATPDQGSCYTHDLTVEQFLDEWMNTKAMTLSSTTLAWYRYVIARHIEPELGQLRMSQLRPVHIQRLYASKLQQVPGGPRPISRSTARCIHRVLHAALSCAVRLQVIGRNPCDAVEVPKAGRPRPRYWRPEEAARFLNAARNDRLFALFHALGTGLRRGELLGAVDRRRSGPTEPDSESGQGQGRR